VDALRTPDPEREMVERLAGFLDAGVALGRLRAGRVPDDDVLAQLRAEPPGVVSVAGWHAVSTPVEQTGRRLVLASRRPLPRLAKPAAEAAAPLLAALARLTDVVRDQEQAVKAALLEEALAPPPRRDPLPLAARAAAFGLDFTSPARMVVIDGDGDAACRALERAGTPHLAHRRDGGVTVLVQGDPEPALAALPGDVAAGVGREVASIADAQHSLRDAELAAGHGPGVTRFEDFDVGTFLVSEVAPDRLGPKVGEILDVLAANPPVHEAVRAYFAHDLDIAATAEAMHMHRNSLRYRLARAEEMLGRSFKQPATIADVHIALVAESKARG
jgi:purine catabolism regulator